MTANPLNYNDLLSLVRDGEAVAGGVVNRPIGQLDARTRYLWDLILAAASGQALFARQATVEADANVGNPLYYNPATQRFERAIAAVAYDADNQGLAVAAAGRVWGVLYRKIDATLADLVLLGRVALDVTNSLQAGEALAAGDYYLSAREAGRLTADRPPAIALGVLRADGNGTVYVAPQWPGAAGHAHLHFRLRAVPAGTHHDTASGRNTIANPNPHVEGWLPAGHEAFAGKAPHDAKFGYTLATNAALDNAWPPLPPAAAVLVKDGVQVPDLADTGDGGLVRFTRDGVWWMSDCVGSCPFPDSIETDFSEASESASESVAPGDCPHETPMRLDLYFARPEFLTDATVVTSLRALDERLRVVCDDGTTAGGAAASTGPLGLKLDLAFLSDDADPGGHLAVKQFDAATQTLHRGPVATGVYAKSNNVTLAGDATTTATIDAVSRTVYHGRVGVDVDTSQDRELFPDLVRLGRATEELKNGVLYLSFPAGQATDLKVRIPVPATLGLAAPTVRLRLRLLAGAAGVVPDLTVTALIVPATDTIDDVPGAEVSVALTTGQTATAAFQYVDAESAALAVAAGDDVTFTIARAGDTDGYPSEVGLLRIAAVVAEGA